MTLKDIEKMHEELANYRVRCECSHTICIPVQFKFKICNYCGRKVYRNKQEEFKDKMRGAIRNVNN